MNWSKSLSMFIAQMQMSINVYKVGFVEGVLFVRRLFFHLKVKKTADLYSLNDFIALEQFSLRNLLVTFTM